MDRKYNIVGDGAALDLAAEISAGYTEAALTAASNKGTYKRAVKDAEAAGEVNICAGLGRVIVYLPDAEVSMCGEISECACGCPSKTICRHIVTAAVMLHTLAADVSEDGNAPAAAEPEYHIPEEKPAAVRDEKYLGEVMNAVSGTLVKGVIACGENDIEVFSRLSLSAPTAHREIGKMCRGFVSDISKMLDRSAAFSSVSAAFRLCRIYNTAAVSMKEAGEQLLFNGNEYEDMGSGDFLCMAVYPYRSPSGFAGVTAVLFEKNSGRYFTYTSGVRDIYEKTENAATLEAITKLMKANSHWQEEVSIKAISGREILLSPFKADSAGRISSSKQTVCSVRGQVDAGVIPKAARLLAPEEEYDYFSPDKKSRFAAVRADSVENIDFDGTLQRLRYDIVSGDMRIPCETVYNELSKTAVRNIKSFDGKQLSNAFFLIRFFGKTAQAVSMIDLGGVWDFYFAG